ncbi:FAD-dependent monooxygenase [Aldersonia sp. NBC_00410]|uniref:FAD-dependent monooxygenase n=1 Tax=Aldersonia sp. NBC_00410 TaxID=2975954 RepID=UPI00225819B0|nr:FAD-dependent monooxygenase [Aldersonia sp. NBC_00410]MCX5042082.1 FAD-dependent monooxygenase [Aldersonia sp. NBC_00410]
MASSRSTTRPQRASSPTSTSPPWCGCPAANNKPGSISTLPADTAFDDDLGHLHGALADWPAPVAALLAATERDAVSRHDIYDRTIARTWISGAVTLVGDAAHPMRPHLGQGGCQALEDAATLAQLLAQQHPVDAFAAYESARRRRALRYVRLSALAGRVQLIPDALRPMAYRLFAGVPERMVARQLSAIASATAFG